MPRGEDDPRRAGQSVPAGERADDDLSVFERAMREVQPLDEGEGPRTVPVRKPPTRRRDEGLGQPVRFHIERWGEPPNERWEATAPGVGRRSLDRLRRGRVRIDRHIDLHGLDAEAAEGEVLDALDRMWQRRERSLLIVHGRGLHSEDFPVLKGSLPEWLAAPPHGRRVLGFVTAPPHLGGAGATLVLLRKRKR